MAWVGLVGAAISAVGAYQKGQAEKGAALYNAEIAKQNSAIALQQGDAAVQAQDRDARRRLGSMVALYGASGAQGNTGSPLDVLADSSRMAELDKLTTQYNYQLKSQGFDNTADLDRASAKNASTSSYLNAASALVGGASGYMGMSGSNSIPSFG